MTEEELSPSEVLPGLRTRYMGRSLIFHVSAVSTQDEASRAAAAGAPEGTVVVAHEQTGGRGRFQRAWIAPPGATLPLSVVLRPPRALLPTLIMVAALAVARAVEEVTGLRPTIKWPNDILVDGRKVCGILVETALSGEEVEYTIVGIGINVDLDTDAFPEIAGAATSLRLALRRLVSRRDLLQRLLESLEALYDAACRGEPVVEWWRERLVTLGQRVRVLGNDGAVEEGIAEDVDDSGALHLRRADGGRSVVVAGDVTLLR